MSETTARLKLPFIAAAQAQKHITHNEALLALDAIIHAAVEDRDLAAPPADPQEGQAWLVAASASGAWAGHDGEMAVWSDGVWCFHAPAAGWIVLVGDENRLIVYNGALWRDFGEMLGALANLDKLGVNTAADDDNRLAAKSDAILFSHDDVTPGSGDIRVKINKKQSGNTASFLFQDNWSGRAEIGLMGGNGFAIKTSTDGADWKEALRIHYTHGGRIAMRGAYIGYASYYRDHIASAGTLEIGGPNGSFMINVQDGAGRMNMRWNASHGPNPKFLASGDRAAEWDIDGFGGFGLTIRESHANPGEGSSVVWDEIFSAGRNGVKSKAPFLLPSFGVPDLPSGESAAPGALIFVSDEAGGPTLAFSDGTNWRRVQDRAVVS